jgi:5-formyltetrahydrofolate cyclo-ligase
VDTGRDASRAKSGLRTRLLARRARRTREERDAAAHAVAAALRSLVESDGGRLRIAAHVPVDVEPGHGTLPAALHRDGVEVLLPISPPGTHELAWAVDDGRFVPGRFGLLEPAGPRLPSSAIARADVVVVPALSIGRDGSRLGRGGGWYDRALASARADAVLVAVVFDDELVDTLPTEPHDRPVTAVVTPGGGWRDLPG